MIGADSDTSTGINIWIGFADVFAGLLLIVITGLVVVLSQRQDENIKFSQDLVRAVNRATLTTKQMQEKLIPLLPKTSERTQFSETQIVIPAGALFAPFGFDDYLNEPDKLKLLAGIRQALKETLDKAGDERRFLRIVIEGHTDSDPIKSSAATRAIPTNWELSSRRATGVLRFFEEGGLNAGGYNIVAMGLADTQPIALNTLETKSKNRRIVIRVEPDIDKMKAALQGEAR